MRAARKTIAWLVLLLLAGSGGGAYYFYKVWEQGDELLRQRMLSKLHEIAPDWDLSIGTTRLDFQGRIRIADFHINLASHKPAAKGMTPAVSRMLDVPEAIITLDKERMTDDKPSIQHVRLVRPTLYVSRHPDGKWSWESLPPIRMGGSLFEWAIEEGIIHVRLDGTADAPGAVTVLKNVHLQLVPAGQEEFEIKASGGTDFASTLSLQAHWGIEKQTWTIDGQLTGMKFGPSLVEFISACSPSFREKGIALENRLAAYTPPTITTQYASPGAPRPESPKPPGREAAWGLTANLDLDFHAKQWQAGAEPEFSANVQMREGTFAHPVFPFPLTDLQGALVCNNRLLQFTKLTARSDTIQFGLDGEIRNPESPTFIGFDISAKDLPFGIPLRNSLPARTQRIYDLMQPTGWMDVGMTLQFDPRNGWRKETDLTFRNCTARHARFPYLIEQISGTMWQRGQNLGLHLDGLAGRRPVTMAGQIENSGPEEKSLFDIRVQKLPLDDRFREACQPGVLKTLDSLQFQGDMDARLVLYRPPGPNQHVTPYLTAQVHGATIKPKAFPYALREFSGTVKSVGEHNWKFENLKGHHEGAELTGSGTYLPDEEGIPHLRLDVSGTNVPLDPNLYQALPDNCQAMHRELSPTGMSSFATAIHWTPGHTPDVEVDLNVADGSFSCKSFPFSLDQVKAAIHWGRGRMTIKSLSGRHDDTYVEFTADGDYVPNDQWRLRLENLLVEDLEPDRRFRKMLPARLREVFETLDPRGKLTVKGMVEFRGTCEPSDPVTAAWNLDTTYSGATLTAGVDLENMHGQVSMKGVWDGETVKSTGSIDLDSVSIKGYQFTELQGAIQIRGNQLILGSEAVIKGEIQSPKPGSKEAREQISAKFINGRVLFDGLANLGKQTTWFVNMDLKEGQLARYAQLYLPGRNQLRGVINGGIRLSGAGASAQRIAGRGHINISPAALYELPIIVQIFKALTLSAGNKTAFNHAFVEFDVGGGQYHIRRADLIGDSVQLRGKGKIAFGGAVSLNFYSMMPKQKMLPIIGDIVGEATKGWVGVEVGGNMANPMAKVRAIPQIDNTLRMFLGLGIPGNGSINHGFVGGHNPPNNQRHHPPRTTTTPTFDARGDTDVTPR